MRGITPHLWFDNQAREAVEFYTSLFPDSRVTGATTLHGVPSPTGDSDVFTFHLGGHPFMAINAGPIFKINPSISFFVNFDPARDEQAREHLDLLWEKLSQKGSALMPLDKYPFSPRYGWVQDRYGVSWQLILSDPAGEPRPLIVPSLLFTGKVAGKAEEAVAFYTSLFKGSRVGTVARYPAGREPDREGTLMYSDFNLSGQWFAAMDSAQPHRFSFNEGVSLVVACEDQAEIDHYWEKMSAVPEAEQCGWIKDKYGVSWQIVPAAMAAMMANGTREQVDRLTRAFLPMKKLDLRALQAAFDGTIPEKRV